MFASTPRVDPKQPTTVSIVGAGPSGLLLARYLQLHDIPVVVYEKEVSGRARGQGGSLDLHSSTGLQALEETGLLERAKGYMRPEGDNLRVLDPTGKVWYDETGLTRSAGQGEQGDADQRGGRVAAGPTRNVECGGPHSSPTADPTAKNRSSSSSGSSMTPISGRPEIDRTDLRNLLLASLEPGTVQWGHSLVSAIALDEDTYELEFTVSPPPLIPSDPVSDAIADPSAAVTHAVKVVSHLLVGADGTFSRIRPLLHDKAPTYSGLTMFDMLIPAGGLTPDLQGIVGPGTAFILGTTTGVYSHETLNTHGTADPTRPRSSPPVTASTFAPGGAAPEQSRHGSTPVPAALIPQMNSGGKCKLYASLQVPHSWLDEHPLPSTGRLEFMASLFPNWNEGKQLIMACDPDAITPRRIYQYPPELQWDSALTGVTIVGDAAHVMSPFAGEGVNQALADGLLLGQTLVSVLRPSVPAALAPVPLSFLPLLPPPPRQTKLDWATDTQRLSTTISPTDTAVQDDDVLPTLPLVNPSRTELHQALRRFEGHMMARARPEMTSSRESLGVAFCGPDAARRFGDFFRYMPLYWLLSLVSEPLGWLRRMVN